MKIEATSLPGVLIVIPKVFGDEGDIFLKRTIKKHLKKPE